MADFEKTERYEEIAKEIKNGEKFLFFTDPHPVSSSPDGRVNEAYESGIALMGEYFDKVKASFALSGGDWLNNSNTREQAIENMKNINSRMEQAFGDSFYLVFGNHDWNYQAKDAEEKIAQSPHWLTEDEINNTWYSSKRYGGKSYFSFVGESTKFYVFNSGIDWGHTSLSELDTRQTEWFLSELCKNDDAHIALAPHMLYAWGSSIMVATDKLLEISESYNNRGTVAFNGSTYDFSDKTGRVEFLIAGHSHRDEVCVFHGIPCILTTSSNGNPCPAFDLVAVDYDKRAINTVRVNSDSADAAAGRDRTISLDIAD